MPRRKPGASTKSQIAAPERHADGQLKDEPRGNAPALVRRIMDHAVSLGADARCATVLGRLHLEGTLTESEFAAGLLYAEDVGAWERLKGHPRRNIRSPSFDSGYGRADLDLEALERMDPEAAGKIKARLARRNKRIEKRYHKVQDMIPDVPNVLATIMDEVCCMDRVVGSVFHPALKAMLGNLAKNCYRLNVQDDKASKRQPKRDKKADAVALGQGAVDALEDWFRRQGAKCGSYRVQVRHALQSRGITGYGRSADGKFFERTVRIKRPGGIKGEAIDVALDRAAEAKGWIRAALPPQEENAA